MRLSVLIIDDDDDKAKRIEQVVEAALGSEHVSITRASDAHGGQEALARERFDVLVLDLLLPRRPGEDPAPETGVRILERLLRTNALKTPGVVIGLSQHADLCKEYEAVFRNELWYLLSYDATNRDWETMFTRRLQNALAFRESATGRVVVSVHGIRTRGAWQKEITPILNRSGFVAEPADYGRFNIFQLMLERQRGKKVKWLRDKYPEICRRNGLGEESARYPSVIAHSFGTFLVAHLLEDYSNVRFDRIILYGSIVRCNFPWAKMLATGRVQAVLNEHGGRDIWATCAHLCVPRAGPSGGRRGFDKVNDSRFHQTYHPTLGHSDLLNEGWYEDRWIPFLQGRDPKTTEGV